tara:strand:- start:12 stop:752 length:741 start_codon:yes stop_codon:yes gene_type:complete
MLLKLSNITKSFGAVSALDGVSLELNDKECLGLLGDNGAGKSTLLKILSGVYKADSGKTYINDKEVDFTDPLLAREAGIEMIYQDLALADELPADANIFLGREQKNNLFGLFKTLDKNTMQDEATKVLSTLGSELDSSRLVNVMSGGERQLVAVARALQFNPTILLMDEPTAALSAEKASHLNKLILSLKKKNLGIILVSHRFSDIFAVCDRIVVLNGGKIADEFLVTDGSFEELSTRVLKIMAGK